MDSKQSDRRRFLRDSAALALAVGGVRSAVGQPARAETPDVHPKDAHAYGERSRFETSSRLPVQFLPFASVGYGQLQLNPIQDQLGIITPAALHFVSSHGHEPPDIDPRQHRLLIHGMVDRPLILTLEELKRLPSVSRVHFVECSGNTSPSSSRVLGKMKDGYRTIHQRYGLTSCSEWTGVPLSLLLKEAGVQKGASWLIAEGADTGKHAKSIPLEKAMDDVLVAYGQNGEAVRPEQGYPLRLVTAGWEGIANVKWLRRIKVVDQPYMGIKESTKYPSLRPDGKARWFLSQLGPKSVITFPSDVHRLPSRGFYEIRGLAWSGWGTIRRVEVSTDGGRTWKDAEVQEPVHRIAHTLFRFPWTWNGEEAVIQSRCTDERGTVQPTLAEIGKIWGVDKEYWQTTGNVVNPFNPIQPWEVARDGSVHNALF